MVRSSSSLALQLVGPAAIIVEPGCILSPLIMGVMVAAIHTIISLDETNSSAVDTAFEDMPRSASTVEASLVLFSGVLL